MVLSEILAIARLGIDLVGLLLTAGNGDEAEEDDKDEDDERKGGAVVIEWGDCSPEYGSRRRRRY